MAHHQQQASCPRDSPIAPPQAIARAAISQPSHGAPHRSAPGPPRAEEQVAVIEGQLLPLISRSHCDLILTNRDLSLSIEIKAGLRQSGGFPQNSPYQLCISGRREPCQALEFAS